MVGADAHSSSEFFATEDDGGEGFVESFEFLGVIRIGVFFNGEFFIIGIVAWVDAYFVDMVDRFHGGGRKEVNVGYKRDVALCVFEGFGDGAEGLGGFFIGCGDTYDFATRFSKG